MALIKKMINEIGQVAEYHKIRNMEIDFANDQIHIYIERYTKQEYRDLEKKELADIKAEIGKINKNKKLDADEKKSKLQVLESKYINPRSIEIAKYTLPLKDVFRKSIYKRIINEIEEFKDAGGDVI